MDANLRFIKNTFGLGSFAYKRASIPFSGLPLDFQSMNGGKPLLESTRFKHQATVAILSSEQLTLILNNQLGVYLKRSTKQRISVLKNNRSWRGLRHLQKLPVRGQRTKTNARTQKKFR